MTRAHTTTDHARIKHWVEKRGGHPVITRSTGNLSSSGKIDALLIDFDHPDSDLASVDWDKFFAAFERKELTFMYQDVAMDGKLSRFSKFIDRYSSEAKDLSQVPETQDNTIDDSETTQISSSAFAASRFADSKSDKPNKTR